MKVTFIEPIASASGKFSTGSDRGLAHHTHRNGGLHSWTVCYGKRKSAFSQAELTRQANFKTAMIATKTRLADPSKQAADLAAFNAQTKYNSVRTMVFAEEYAKL